MNEEKLIGFLEYIFATCLASESALQEGVGDNSAGHFPPAY